MVMMILKQGKKTKREKGNQVVFTFNPFSLSKRVFHLFCTLDWYKIFSKMGGV